MKFQTNYDKFVFIPRLYAMGVILIALFNLKLFEDEEMFAGIKALIAMRRTNPYEYRLYVFIFEIWFMLLAIEMMAGIFGINRRWEYEYKQFHNIAMRKYELEDKDVDRDFEELERKYGYELNAKIIREELRKVVIPNAQEKQGSKLKMYLLRFLHYFIMMGLVCVMVVSDIFITSNYISTMIYIVGTMLVYILILQLTVPIIKKVSK